jgi:hypothetical protein
MRLLGSAPESFTDQKFIEAHCISLFNLPATILRAQKAKVDQARLFATQIYITEQL